MIWYLIATPSRRTPPHVLKNPAPAVTSHFLAGVEPALRGRHAPIDLCDRDALPAVARPASGRADGLPHPGLELPARQAAPVSYQPDCFVFKFLRGPPSCLGDHSFLRFHHSPPSGGVCEIMGRLTLLCQLISELEFQFVLRKMVRIDEILYRTVEITVDLCLSDLFSVYFNS